VTGLQVSLETITRDERSVTLALRGEFDLANISIVRIALADHLRHGRCVIRLDMNGVEYLDSTMLGVLVEAHQRCHDKGGSLILIGVPDRVRRVLRIAGLDRLLLTDGALGVGVEPGGSERLQRPAMGRD
jgi:anti-sigma B factor antagonist